MMGWGLGDDERKETARLQLSALRAAVYKPHRELLATVTEVVHDDKRCALIKAMTDVYRALDEVERQLHR